MVNVTTVLVQWQVPFTWTNFSITNYTLTVEIVNQTSTEAEVSILNADTLSYYLTQTGPSSSCVNLTFSVVASNSNGPSLPGRTQGSFPSSELTTIFILSEQVVAPSYRAWSIPGVSTK